MNHPTEGQLSRDPVEARIPAVFVAVLATWVLIGAWWVLRQFML